MLSMIKEHMGNTQKSNENLSKFSLKPHLRKLILTELREDESDQGKSRAEIAAHVAQLEDLIRQGMLPLLNICSLKEANLSLELIAVKAVIQGSKERQFLQRGAMRQLFYRTIISDRVDMVEELLDAFEGLEEDEKKFYFDPCSLLLELFQYHKIQKDTASVSPFLEAYMDEVEVLSKKDYEEFEHYSPKGKASFLSKMIMNLIQRKKISPVFYSPCFPPPRAFVSGSKPDLAEWSAVEANVRIRVQGEEEDTEEKNEEDEELNYKSVIMKQSAIDLMVWSALLGRKEMADAFWKRTSQSVQTALLSATIFLGIASLENNVDDKEEFTQCAKYFEQRAMAVLDRCYRENPEATSEQLLTDELPLFAGFSTLEVAMEKECLDFLSHPACQDAGNLLWNGALSRQAGTFRIALGVICPLTLLSSKFIIFRQLSAEMELKKAQAPALAKKPRSRTGSTSSATRRGSSLHGSQTGSMSSVNARPKPLSERAKPKADQPWMTKFFRRVTLFYCSPKVIFSSYLLFYFMFLILFSTSLVFVPKHSDLYLTIAAILSVWVIALVSIEIYQLITTDDRPGKGVKERLAAYTNSVWNLLDIGCIVTFFIGIICINIPQEDEKHFLTEIYQTLQDIGLGSLCVSLLIFYFRLLNAFGASSEVGPKLVIIGRMLKDVAVIWALLSVMMLAYGFTSDAILYPHEQNKGLRTITRLLGRAYWEIFGELNLDEMKPEEGCVNPPAMVSSTEEPSTSIWTTPFTFTTAVSSYLINSYENIYDKNLSYTIWTTSTPFSEASALQNVSDSTSPESEKASSEEGERKLCPHPLGQNLGPIFLIVYNLITAMILINVLGAMFFHTYEVVSEQSHSYWQLQRIELINEYLSMPPVPPPFVLIWNIFVLIRWLVFKCTKKSILECLNVQAGLRKSIYREDLLSEDALIGWQSQNAALCVRTTEKEEESSPEALTYDIHNSMRKLKERVENLTSITITNGQASRREDSMMITYCREIRSRVDSLDQKITNTQDLLKQLIEKVNK